MNYENRDLRRNGSGCLDLTAYEAIKNIQQKEIRRGDIFFVEQGLNIKTGHEESADRPAIIVSNDQCNTYSEVVEVVFLTTKAKKPMPTHVEVDCQRPSTALCEQIFSVSKERLGKYYRTCTAEEMKRVDNALMVSLGIPMPFVSGERVEEPKQESPENNFYKDLYGDQLLKTAKLESEVDLYKGLYEHLLAKITG